MQKAERKSTKLFVGPFQWLCANLNVYIYIHAHTNTRTYKYIYAFTFIAEWEAFFCIQSVQQFPVFPPLAARRHNKEYPDIE